MSQTTIEEHQKWIAVFDQRIAELTTELDEARALRNRALAEIDDLQTGHAVGDRISWWEDSCQRGCCGDWLSGVVVAKLGLGWYEIATEGRSSTEKMHKRDFKKKG